MLAVTANNVESVCALHAAGASVSVADEVRHDGIRVQP